MPAFSQSQIFFFFCLLRAPLHYLLWAHHHLQDLSVAALPSLSSPSSSSGIIPTTTYLVLPTVVLPYGPVPLLNHAKHPS
jgi:hypothetical protein